MKTLKLEHDLALLVREGKKNTTWRIFDDKNLSVNDHINFIDKVNPKDTSSWVVFGEAIVTEVKEKRIADLSDIDYDETHSYSSKDELINSLRQFYGESINEETPVKIIKFHALHTDEALNKQNLTDAKLYADGGSRGNPGPSAGGFVILTLDNNVVEKSGKYLGITTNNQAEYHSLKGGVEAALKLGIKNLDVYMDSLLVVNQMKGIYKIRNRDLWPIYEAIKELSGKFDKITFSHVPRELNKLADSIVNETLDSQKN